MQPELSQAQVKRMIAAWLREGWDKHIKGTDFEELFQEKIDELEAEAESLERVAEDKLLYGDNSEH